MEFIIPTPDQPLHPHIAGKLIHEIPFGTGAGEQGRFNGWSYNVTLVHDHFRTLFGLRATIGHDPDDDLGDTGDEEQEPFFMLVMTDPLVDDDDWIAWRLVQEYAKLKRPAIQFWADTNEVDFDRGEQMNWELGLEH